MQSDELDISDKHPSDYECCSRCLKDKRLKPNCRECAEPILFSKIDELRECLAELHATVKGECPSLFNEDSGGNPELDYRIQKALYLWK